MMTINQRYNSSAPYVARPRSVTLLALVVLSIAILNLVRCWQALAQRNFLADLLPLPPAYLMVSGMIWGIVGLPLFWSLLKGKNWAPHLMRIGSLAYSLYYWLDRFMVKVEVANNNLPFMMIANLAILGLIYWILSRRKALIFFGVLYA